MKDQYFVKSVDEVFEEMKKGEADNKTSVFTKEEAQELLTVMLEDEARWALRKYYPSKSSDNKMYSEPILANGGTTVDNTLQLPTAEQLGDVVDYVYKYIVKQWRYDPITLQICRKASYDINFVADIVEEVNKQMEKDAAPMSKALSRSLDRVAESMAMTKDQILKAKVDFEDIVKSGIARPERVYTFLVYRGD